jgi:hypothetical protein
VVAILEKEGGMKLEELLNHIKEGAKAVVILDRPGSDEWEMITNINMSMEKALELVTKMAAKMVTAYVSRVTDEGEEETPPPLGDVVDSL